MPGVSGGAKAGKVANIIRRSAKTIGKAFAIYGLGDAIPSLERIASGKGQ